MHRNNVTQTWFARFKYPFPVKVSKAFRILKLMNRGSLRPIKKKLNANYLYYFMITKFIYSLLQRVKCKIANYTKVLFF